MDGETFRQGVDPKLLDTCNLSDTFSSRDLDFFVMLSSIFGVLGIRSQANYAAGNAFQDAFAQAQIQSRTRYTSLNLGMVSGFAIITTFFQESLNRLYREGGLLLSLDQVLALLAYSMGLSDGNHHSKQLVLGFDRDSLAHNCGFTLCQPLFSHVAKSGARTSQQTTTAEEETIGSVILMIGDPNEVHRSVLRALVKQISTIMVMDEEKVDLNAQTADLGLDFLIAVELKNWICRTFQAAFQISKILDMSSIRDFATIIVKRSRLVSDHLRTNDQKHKANMEDPAKPQTAASLSLELPVMSLPDLADTIALYQESVSALLTDRKAQQLDESVQQFLALDGLDQRLQRRLQAPEANTKLDGWLSDLYNAHVYFKNRASVNPFQHFYGSHIASLVQHSQAERATIIAIAAMEFKTLIDTNRVATDMLNDEPLCMDSLDWIFNASRKPYIGVDEMQRFPRHDYVVVMRHGHYFKVDLKNRQVAQLQL